MSAAIRGLLDAGGRNLDDEVLLLYRESKSLPKRLLKNILARESEVVSHIETILKKGKARKIFAVEDTSYTANLIVYQLCVYPLRHWNMKEYNREELSDLMVKHVLKMVLA